METTNINAFKEGKIRPTKDGLKDSKRTGEDCNVLIGITNPDSFDLPDYKGYPIRNSLGSHFRMLEIVLNRNGEANTLCPLYFDGAINRYEELPSPDNKPALDRCIEYVKNLEAKEKAELERLRNTSFNNNSAVLFINSLKYQLTSLQRRNIFTIFASQLKKLINKWQM